jgi:hypothetical protein
MNIILIVDWRTIPNDNFWLKTELQKLGNQVELMSIPNYNDNNRIMKFGNYILWQKYFVTAIKAIKKSKEKDIIISWNFIIGAIAAFICRLLHLKKNIISINMIFHKNGLFNDSVRKIIYNIAFRYPKFCFSLIDEKLIDYYSLYFALPKTRIFFLQEVFNDSYEQRTFEETDDYVFSGGEAYRDWPNIIKCAEELPEINFVGVARFKKFPHDKLIPKNLKMYYDIPQDEFDTLMRKSRIVFLPLNSLAPCGLIVLVKAALLSKPVIVTETYSTKHYVHNNSSGRLIKMHDFNEMRNSILLLSNSMDLRKLYAENFKNHVTNMFTPQYFAYTLNAFVKANF